MNDTNARVENFVAALKLQFPSKVNGEFASRENTEQRRLRTVLRECGASRYSAAILRLLAAELSKQRVYSDWSLLDPALRRDDWVRFAPLPFQPDALFFGKEDDLRTFVLNGIGVVDPFRGLKVLAQEHPLPNNLRIDILCEEIRRGGKGNLVVLEFKRGNSPDGVVGQVVRYLEELSKTPLAAGRGVRAIILSGRQDCVVSELLTAYEKYRIESYCYSVKFTRVAQSSVVATD